MRVPPHAPVKNLAVVLLRKRREVPRVRNPNQEGRKTLLGGHQVKISWGPCKNLNILHIIDYSSRKKAIDHFKILVCLWRFTFFCKTGVFLTIRVENQLCDITTQIVTIVIFEHIP